MLVAIVAMLVDAAPRTFRAADPPVLDGPGHMQWAGRSAGGMQTLLWLAFFASFAVKMPSGRSTPGCPTPTSRRPPRARS